MKNSIIISFLLLAGMCLFGSSVSAYETEKIVLQFNDREIRSNKHDPEQIYLKKELRKHYPHLDITELELRKVVVLAKSRKGRGTVQLRVGRNLTSKNIISGNQYIYTSSARNTFDRLQLSPPSLNSSGPWQLLLRGNIILRKVVLFIDKKNHSHFPGYHQFPGRDYPSTGWQNSNSWQHDPPRNRSLTLPADRWGTEIEGLRYCGTRSANVRDGWDYPDTICSSGARTTYRSSGHRPVKLFITPKIEPLSQLGPYSRIHRLRIDLHIVAVSGKKNNAPLSATFGVDINGQTHTGRIYLTPSRARKGGEVSQTIEITGNWNKNDIRKSVVWILPNQESGDFTVRSLQIVANDQG